MTLKSCQLESIGKTSATTIIALIIFIVFLLFLLQNVTTVDIRFLIWKVSMSRVFLLLGSLIVGCIIGILIGWELFRKKGRSDKTESDTPSRPL